MDLKYYYQCICDKYGADSREARAFYNKHLRKYEPVRTAPPLRKKNPAVKQEKVGRNEPCPCGSGKKHKKCCLCGGEEL